MRHFLFSGTIVVLMRVGGLIIVSGFVLVPQQRLPPLYPHHPFRLTPRQSVTSQQQQQLLQDSAEAPTTITSNSTTTATDTARVVYSSFFGVLYPLSMPAGQEEEASFVGKMAVPTFGTRIMTNHKNESKASDYYDSSIAKMAKVRRLHYRGLEGALGQEQGPAFCLDHVMTHDECESIIETCENQLGGFGQYEAGKNHHGALQIVVTEQVAEKLAQRLSRHVDLQQVQQRRQEMESINNVDKSVINDNRDDDNYTDETEEDVRLVYRGLNRRWRIYRYAPGGQERFAPHIDASFPPSGLSDDGRELIWDITSTTSGSKEGEEKKEVVSRLTILFYLNDDFEGGHTKFYQPLASRSPLSKSSGNHDDELHVIASVRPVAGSCLVFPQGVGEAAVDYARQHWPLHEGSPVLSGRRPKYVIRSDVLFATQRQELTSPTALITDDPLFRYDHLVRQTFLPTSPALDHKFLSHLESLYNPHMGVENMGTFLYSFLRLTKKRKIVEIGAGYTSLWILQALADNDQELERIRELQQAGQCRLLDWPWTNHEKVVQTLDGEAASLLCIDNLEHQKQSATGVSAIALALGLSSYMQFLRGDAFELDLQPKSVDVLWCDFGVGSRMRDFVAATWASLRPGGFLLCHSTLTNQKTRMWLETVRARKGIDETGMPPDEYVELSLLEPHKHYQNSISIFQKRRGYNEPIYSEYA